MKNTSGTNIPMPHFPRNVLPKICVEIAMDSDNNVVSGFHSKQQSHDKFGGEYLSYRFDRHYNQVLRSVHILPTDHSYFYCFPNAHLNCHGVISDDDYRMYNAELAEKSHIAVFRGSDTVDSFGVSEGQMCQDETISAIMSNHPLFQDHFEQLLETGLNIDFIYQFMTEFDGAAPKKDALRGAHFQYDGGYVYVMKQIHKCPSLFKSHNFATSDSFFFLSLLFI